MDYISLNKISSWGKNFNLNIKVFFPKNIHDLKKIIFTKKKIIPSGNLRSYGDSAINKNIIQSKFLNKIINFNSKTGILIVQSGVTIDQLLKFLVPKGWFLKVTPGTKFVTIGGCAASDVHGKEHHINGCFSNNIISLKILTGNGKIIICSKNQNKNIFNSVCGGMGTVGFITEVKLKCKKIHSNYINQKTILSYNLKSLFALFEKYKKKNYSVAWLDTYEENNNYKSIFFCGGFLPRYHFKKVNEKSYKVPFKFKLINNITVKIFNCTYFFLKKLSPKNQILNFESFFYPLDKIKNFNYLYGEQGMLQYQFVLPKKVSYDGFFEILKKLNKLKLFSSLAVVKLHKKKNKNYLSFPIEGYSLALDFPDTQELRKVLNQIDKIVLKYCGKVYLTKDLRLNKNMFQKFYPEYKKLIKIKKKLKCSKFASLQSERLGI